MLLVMGQWVFRAPFWQKMFGLLSLPIVVYTLLATERRAGYIAIMIGFIIFTLVFLMTHRKAFFFVCLPMIVATHPGQASNDIAAGALLLAAAALLVEGSLAVPASACAGLAAGLAIGTKVTAAAGEAFKKSS